MEIKLYTTLEKEASCELTERKSIFIGYAAPIKNENEASEFIRRIGAMNGNATHNVYAYMLDGGRVARYSDAGEPQGTAGIPVLEVIRKSGVSDAAIVVTRYFGGILLGAGGLVRAYSAASRAALDAAHIVTYEGYSEFILKCSYSDYPRIQNEIPKFGIIQDDISFDEKVNLKLAIKDALFDDFKNKISEYSSGKLQPVVTGTRFDFR